MAVLDRFHCIYIFAQCVYIRRHASNNNFYIAKIGYMYMYLLLIFTIASTFSDLQL